MLFSGTILDNISLGLDTEGMGAAAVKELVVSAAKKANAHSFVESFPDGYDTDIATDGALLSGGQKQRVAVSGDLNGLLCFFASSVFECLLAFFLLKSVFFASFVFFVSFANCLPPFVANLYFPCKPLHPPPPPPPPPPSSPCCLSRVFDE